MEFEMKEINEGKPPTPKKNKSKYSMFVTLTEVEWFLGDNKTWWVSQLILLCYPEKDSIRQKRDVITEHSKGKMRSIWAVLMKASFGILESPQEHMIFFFISL